MSLPASPLMAFRPAPPFSVSFPPLPNMSSLWFEPVYVSSPSVRTMNGIGSRLRWLDSSLSVSCGAVDWFVVRQNGGECAPTDSTRLLPHLRGAPRRHRTEDSSARCLD